MKGDFWIFLVVGSFQDFCYFYCLGMMILTVAGMFLDV